MTTVRTQKQICAFIDVLGGALLFQNKNRSRASSFFSCLEEFERRLNGWSHHFPKRRRSSALVKTFSDNIFVAFPFESSSKMNNHEVVRIFLEELKHQIHEITLYAGFPLRGAVSVGGLMFTDKFLYGPALVEAVQLEKTAIFPRVLLSPSVLKYIEPDDAIADLAIQDADGKTFLHYLSGLGEFGVSLQYHRDYVHRGLVQNAGKVHERQKYEWLAQYHNHSVRRAGRADLEITIERENSFHANGLIIPVAN